MKKFYLFLFICGICIFANAQEERTVAHYLAVADSLYAEANIRSKEKLYYRAAVDLMNAAEYYEKARDNSKAAQSYYLAAFCYAARSNSTDITPEVKYRDAKKIVYFVEKSDDVNKVAVQTFHEQYDNYVYQIAGIAFYNKGVDLYNEGKYSDAIKAVENSEMCFLKYDDQEKAEQAVSLAEKCEKELKAEKDKKELALGKAKDLVGKACKSYSLGKLDQAKLYIDSACDLYSSDIHKIANNYMDLLCTAGLIYGRIGEMAPEKDSMWCNKIEHYLMYSWGDEKEILWSYVNDILAEGYYVKGNKYYNDKEYSDAISWLKSSISRYSRYPGDLYNRRGVAAAYLKLAMCYAKIGEDLETSASEKYSSYKNDWIGDAIHSVANWRRCNVEETDEEYKIKYIYETVGKGLYNKGMILYDSGFYHPAEIMADSARKYFVTTENNTWGGMARTLADRCRTQMQTVVQIPEDEVSEDIKEDVPNSGKENNSTYVFVLKSNGYSCGDGCWCNYGRREDYLLFNEYCNKTLGIPQNHIKVISAVSDDSVMACINAIKDCSRKCNGELNVIFLYYGFAVRVLHPVICDYYLSPLDDEGFDFTINQLFDELGKIKTRYTFCLIDAARNYNCLSLQSARIKINDEDEESIPPKKGSTVRIKPQGGNNSRLKKLIQDNLVVIALDDISGDKYKNHSCDDLVSYYFLKKLQQTRGDVSLGDLYDYINYNVRRVSFEKTGEFQTPAVMVSPNLLSTWRDIKL